MDREKWIDNKDILEYIVRVSVINFTPWSLAKLAIAICIYSGAIKNTQDLCGFAGLI